MTINFCSSLWVAALLLLGNSSSEAAGSLRSVSTTERNNVAGAGSSFTPIFNTDGRFIAFVSNAKNLVTNTVPGPNLNVFVRDLANSNTVLVSANIVGNGGGNADANSPSISSNGQFVAFSSAASNFANNDTNDAPDIFVRDLASGMTTLVSVDVTGVSSAGVLSSWTRHRLSSNPQISADGRWVIFESLATNLVALEDTNQTTDIFARDLQTKTTYLVSVNAAGSGSANAASDSPSLSLDGHLVAFVSAANNLVPGATNQLGDIYVRDMTAGRTVWASVNVSQYIVGTY